MKRNRSVRWQVQPIPMGNVGVIWASAASLDELQKELSRLLADHDPDDVVSVSHAVASVGERRSGGWWGGGVTSSDVEYSAVVLVRIS